jgi:hypothetical protein
VVSLVKSQIKATRRTVRAVLMVGGFGQNAYLKERITVSINRNIEVIQTINRYILSCSWRTYAVYILKNESLAGQP